MKKNVQRHVVRQPEDGSIRLIALSKGMNAIVDANQFEILDQFNWSVHNSPVPGKFYAARCVDGKTFFIHWAILPRPEGMVIDHINGDGLDNRLSNLRLATQAENTRNASLRKDSKSGIKGVYWAQSHWKWRVNIQADRKRVFVGLFRSLEEAGSAYQEAAKRLHGEFARNY